MLCRVDAPYRTVFNFHLCQFWFASTSCDTAAAKYECIHIVVDDRSLVKVNYAERPVHLQCDNKILLKSQDV